MHFLPKLLRTVVRDNYVNPGETLWVTAYWQCAGAAEQDYTFFLDAELGHQRKPEHKQYYFRTLAASQPGVTRWRDGGCAAVTFRWDILADWSGTYHLTIGILDGNNAPIAFIGRGGKETYSQYIGYTDISWNMGRPWVAEHREQTETRFNEETTGAAPVPAETVNQIISLSGGFNAVFAAESPALLSLRAGGKTYGCSAGAPRVTFWNPRTGTLLADGENGCAVTYTLNGANERAARYKGRALINGACEIDFEIHISLDGNIMTFTLQHVNELNGGGWELLAVRFVFCEMEDGFLLDFFNGGRLIPIAESTPMFYEKAYDVRNAAALFDAENMFIVESTHLDSLLHTGVTEVNGRKRGIIGGGIAHKIKAEKGFSSIPVKTPPAFTLEAPVLTEPPSWQAAARLFRRGLRRNAAFELYRNRHLYKQLATWGPCPGEQYRADPFQTTRNLFTSAPFTELSDNVRRFHNLTDGAGQVMYVGGWQEGGFDYTSPWPEGAEARCGGTDALRRCLTDARRYNCLSGLHDNFDDIAEDFAADFPHTAVDERGELYRGWIWPAGLSYITGISKYVNSGGAEERIEHTLNLFPLEKTHHIDVLSAETCRYDFDPERPASAQDSFGAKLRIIELFNQRGIDVTSELLTHPMVGRIGFALHNRTDRREVYIPGGSFVPLAQMIYHGFVGYCAPGGTRAETLWALLLGGQSFIETDTAGPRSIAGYYIQSLPAMLLYGRLMLDFTFTASGARADYENARVEADFQKETYSVYADGALIARNFTTFVSWKDGYLAYSLDGGEVEYPLPDGLKNVEIRARTLTGEGAGELLDCCETVGGNTLRMRLPAMTPVKITVQK